MAVNTSLIKMGRVYSRHSIAYTLTRTWNSKLEECVWKGIVRIYYEVLQPFLSVLYSVGNLEYCNSLSNWISFRAIVSVGALSVYIYTSVTELSLLSHFTLSLPLSLSSSKKAQPINHPPATTIQYHPTTTIITHNIPAKKSMENQTKNQQKIEPKIKPKLTLKLLSPVPWKLGWSVCCYHERVKIWTTIYGGVAVDLCYHRWWHGEGFRAFGPIRSSRWALAMADRERKRVLGSTWLEEWKSGRMEN